MPPPGCRSQAPLWVAPTLLLGLVPRAAMSGVALTLSLILAVQLRPWAPGQLALFAAMLFLFAIPAVVSAAVLVVAAAAEPAFRASAAH